MVKPAGPGVYTATYSNIPVYEFQFGEGLKEHVMRRRHDDWINATHILKAAGFDKPARTRILEREVQKEIHEKVQGGYGKYQGTWVPLEQGEALAQRNNVYEKLRTIFEFTPGNLSPPPAPKHTTAKPKLPKKPAVPKWSNRAVAAPTRTMDDDYENASAQLNDDDSVPDDTTVASASFMAEDDRYDVSQQGTGHRKRKRDEDAQAAHDQAHVLYADELLDYFMLHDTPSAPKPEPPINFNADWVIDSDGHSAMHWAAAMGDLSVIRELIKHNATLSAQNARGETPLMRSVMFTNCLDKKSMPSVVKELISTIDAVDFCQSTALHHAAAITSSRQKNQCARYYIDIILNKMQEVFDPDQVQRVLDAQDVDGNTAVHIAATNGARKCVRALIGRGASTSIYNNERVTAEDIIQILNKTRDVDHRPARSSSPYQPSNDQALYGGMPEEPLRTTSHHSEAAMSIESKIIPLMHEKFQDLAASFDEEFQEKEISEREARRILTATIHELDVISGQILDIEYQEDREVERVNIAQLAELETEVTGLIEQQQKMQLHTRTQREQSKSNGHMMSDDDVAERTMLAKMLVDEQKNRATLVGQYRDALSLAGAGEKGDIYRRLISKCVGTDAETMDEEMLDSLIDQLQDDRHGQDYETMIPGDTL